MAGACLTAMGQQYEDIELVFMCTCACAPGVQMPLVLTLSCTL